MLNFFRLWFGVRRTTTDEHIIGEDTLGMKPVEDKTYHLPRHFHDASQLCASLGRELPQRKETRTPGMTRPTVHPYPFQPSTNISPATLLHPPIHHGTPPECECVPVALPLQHEAV